MMSSFNDVSLYLYSYPCITYVRTYMVRAIDLPINAYSSIVPNFCHSEVYIGALVIQRIPETRRQQDIYRLGVRYQPSGLSRKTCSHSLVFFV